MKIKFIILLILSTALLILLVYTLLYEAEHHSGKLVLSVLSTVIILYIFLFFRFYIRYFNLTARDVKNRGKNKR